MHIVNDANGNVWESYQPFQDFFRVDSKGWTVPDHERIRDLTRYQAVLANCATEHWGDTMSLVHQLHDLFRQHELPNFLILTHDPDCESLDSRIMYFPYWLWKTTQYSLTLPDVDSRKSFWFSSLGGRARTFRIANYLALQHKPYRQNGLVSVYGRENISDQYQEGFVLAPCESLDWNMIKHQLPADHADDFSRLMIDHPAWSDTYLNLVNESTVRQGIFITEKTWKPIMAGQLFLILGNQAIIHELRRLGFDVFDDVIDHSYDRETDARARLNMIHAELDRIMPDIVGIYHHTREQRLENWKRFTGHSMITPFLESIKNLLSL